MPAVLLVEHDEAVGSHLAQTLKSSLQCEVILAIENTSWLNVVDKLLPEVILLSVHLTCMHAVDICRALRGSDPTGHIPIALLAFRSVDPDIIVRGLEAGAGDYFFLPADDKELADRVRIMKMTARRRGRSIQTGDAADSLSAHTAHQLRSPLNSIMGLAELMQKPFYGQLTQKQTHFLQTIGESSRRLLNLINELEQSVDSRES